MIALECLIVLMAIALNTIFLDQNLLVRKLDQDIQVQNSFNIAEQPSGVICVSFAVRKLVKYFDPEKFLIS